MADTSQYLQYYKPGQENSTIYTTADILKSAATPGSNNGVTYEQFLKNSGYIPQGQQAQQSQPTPQPSLTVSSSDLVNRPLVTSQSSSYRPPALPTYNQPAAPVYTPPAQTALPELPKLQQINLGNAPVVQSQDQLLQQIQNQIKPLSDQEQQNIKQGVKAAFDPQFSDQQRVNDTRGLFERAAAAQRGDLGFGTSELAYTGLANVQQAGADALSRLRAAQVAEENTRVQAANEGNRAKQIELFNMANQLRDQQQREYQTYIQNQVTANDMALQDYKINLENTRFANEQARQQAMDQFESAKYQNDLNRQQYQDQLQAYESERARAKDTLAMISELGAKEIDSLGGLGDIEASIGLPIGFVNALQRTKLSAENAKNNAQISDVYNQGVQLAMSLPVGQSFSLKNPDGSTTSFQGTQPNEFQIINNSTGVWRVNKDTGEIEQLQDFTAPTTTTASRTASSSSSGSSGTNILPPVNFGTSNTPSSTFSSIPSSASQLGLKSAGLLGASIAAGQKSSQSIATVPQVTKPNVDLSKFDPQIQLILKGQTTYDKLSAKDKTRLANQFNQALDLGLLPGQGQAQASQAKALSGDAAKVSSIAETLVPDIEALKAEFSKDYKKALTGIVSGTDRRLVKLVDNAADKVGRLRSGGAINKDEEARFKKQIASFGDLAFGKSTDAITALNGIINEANIVKQGISGSIKTPPANASSVSNNQAQSLRSKYNY